MKFMKSQSAMEYLMTYGWAIAIIVLALAALYFLGVFNPLNSAAKATPGSCNVYRPNGPGTTPGISLTGLCTNLIPQFVTTYGSTTCPGTGDPAFVPDLSFTSANSITITFWLTQTHITGTPSYVSLPASPSSASVSCTQNGATDLSCTIGSTTVAGSTGFPNSQWIFGAVTVSSSGAATVYLNGQSVGSGSDASWGIGPAGLTTFNMFSSHSSAACTEGSMSNVQLYSTALSSNSISALYQEGIGGAPIDLQDLQGWWPLNGNINDYSANGQNGVANGIVYNSNWWSSFTNP